MTEDSWEEVHEDEMGVGGICDRQYGYITATDFLDNLNSTLGIVGAISPKITGRQHSERFLDNRISIFCSSLR